MIILDILQNILDIFPHLILGAGYSIFGGMAGGSQSGKLTFKKLYGGTNVTLAANTQIIAIYDTTSTSGTPISNCIIAVGTGTDIADSFLSVESGIRKCAIDGAAGINSANLTCNNSPDDSMILGGCQSTILSKRSSILGGRCNIIKHCSYLGGGKSAYDNLILGGRNNKLYTGQNSNLDYLDNSILSGTENKSYCSLNSSILSGNKNYICKVGCYETPTKIYTSPTIIQGRANYMCCLFSNRGPRLIVNGINNSVTLCSSFIDNGKGHTLHGEYSSILNGCQNVIGGLSGGKPYKTNYTTIVNGFCNCILSYNKTNYSMRSVIINGCNNKIICREQYGSSVLNGKANVIFKNTYTTVLNGSKNLICDDGTIGSSNSILSGYNNLIRGATTPVGNSILNGKQNGFVYSGSHLPVYNLVVNGYDNRMNGYPIKYSSIIGKRGNEINSGGTGNEMNMIIGNIRNHILCNSNNSTIIGNYQNLIGSTTGLSSNNVIIGLCCNQITSTSNNTSHNSILGGMHNTIYRSCYLNSIVASCNSVITNTNTTLSSVLASESSSVSTSSISSMVIGSYYSKICCGCGSVIINSRKSNIAPVGGIMVCNSATIAIAGTTMSCSNLVCTNIVQTFGTMSVKTSMASAKCDGLSFCNTIGSTICRIVAVRGIITCIVTI